MNAADLKRVLEDESVLDEFEQDRRYLGMSAIGQCPRRLYNWMVYGRSKPDIETRRYCHEGYLHENDIVDRLICAGLMVLNRGAEIVAPFDDRFRGHIDGELDDGLLLEVKSVTADKFAQVRRTGALPLHAAQVQAYMRYGKYTTAFIVYKLRDTGEIWCVDVDVDAEAGAQLERKARQVLMAVDMGSPPACECGRCG